MTRKPLCVCFGSVFLLMDAAAAQTGIVFIPSLPGGFGSGASAISLDARWIAGASSSPAAGPGYFEAIRWSAATGMQSLGPYNGSYRSHALDISGDGAVVVGRMDPGDLPFRWTEATGKQSLGSGIPRAVSADGSVVVGDFANVGFVWTAAAGQVFLPAPSLVTGLSADGTLAAGFYAGPGHRRAFRWEIGSPPFILGSLPGTTSDTTAECISPDGDIVGGWGDGGALWRAWVWTSQHGYVIMPAPPNWYECVPKAISADGRKAIGYCTAGVNFMHVIWTGPGPEGPYTAHLLHEYLTQRGISLPANTVLHSAGDITGDGTIIVGGSSVNGYFYAYRAELCYANCDDSPVPGMLNVADFGCFLQRYSEASTRSHQHQLYHYANCDRSTTPPVLNIADFACFLQKFAAGCP